MDIFEQARIEIERFKVNQQKAEEYTANLNTLLEQMKTEFEKSKNVIDSYFLKYSATTEEFINKSMSLLNEHKSINDSYRLDLKNDVLSVNDYIQKQKETIYTEVESLQKSIEHSNVLLQNNNTKIEEIINNLDNSIEHISSSISVKIAAIEEIISTFSDKINLIEKIVLDTAEIRNIKKELKLFKIISLCLLIVNTIVLIIILFTK